MVRFLLIVLNEHSTDVHLTISDVIDLFWQDLFLYNGLTWSVISFQPLISMTLFILEDFWQFDDRDPHPSCLWTTLIKRPDWDRHSDWLLLCPIFLKEKQTKHCNGTPCMWSAYLAFLVDGGGLTWCPWRVILYDDSHRDILLKKLELIKKVIAQRFECCHSKALLSICASLSSQKEVA